jgi:hypothetical protein
MNAKSPKQYTYFVGAFAHNAVSFAQQQDRLNELGLQGWELVSVTPEMHGDVAYNYFYFRREFRPRPNPKLKQKK